VLIVTNMWPHSAHPAYGIFIKRQVDSLEALGLECEVLFVEGYRSRWAYTGAALKLLRLNFSRRRPVLVHGHGGETALVVRWYVRGAVVASYCGDDLLGTPRADGTLTRGSRLRRFVLRRQARMMSATVTKSAEMAAALPRAVRRRNLVVPNGVDRNLFRPLPQDEARRELGWPSAERVVLFAADPKVERKRFWLADAACREAERATGPIRLEVAWGVAPAEMPRVMAAADCLLLTSAIEGSPNVVKEAVTCGLPVVATDVGDVAEVLSGVDPSWVCAAEPRPLAEALARCLSERERSNGWEQSAWLGEDEIATRLVALYDRIAPGFAPTLVGP
jgi:glycosyltransferase involved in cell wall biosynthesis